MPPTKWGVFMDEIKGLLRTAADRYNRVQPHSDEVRALVVAAQRKLYVGAEFRAYGQYAGKPPVEYYVFSGNQSVSRPVRPDLYIAEPEEFRRDFEYLVRNLRLDPVVWSEAEMAVANRVVYTSVMAVACCYDVWQRGSRKTPGTVFEILMAALLQTMLTKASFSKHIPLAAILANAEGGAAVRELAEPTPHDDAEGPSSVATDLVIKNSAGDVGGVVIPLKINTRERIVQPFAHQRILDSAFGKGTFKSLLVCISETQLDEKTQSVKQVCVPGTVKLFQKHLAPMYGLYYCDIPQRYAAGDMEQVLPVKPIGRLFGDVKEMLEN
jgi:hypothetical protein